ncbi:hypothetical protein acsn021_36270 [Anaerocolumna cellulosilytica]|uniref:Peptidase S8/S53 domain-containing protein n=1 Tax=Anaerocolumna cellulosilytica TaxID=433286 RepID=A0A6S6RAU2_9FIRM|nr:S8 family peptidase [Anaerocolumna cellulosilytica]MBB5195105.1 hypothetical protein [Anaerocolumna cellulosilytica]BCJ96058.1 hypothetical protein acsn021_36270 [Anaerocolumna cellulosilytica]
MTEEERYKITSNDYMDLLVEGYENGFVNPFEKYTGFSINRVNDRFATVHIPAENLTYDSVQKFGYSLLPKCYGLLSPSSLEASGVEQLRKVPGFNLRGQGVLIGFVDTGIDYLNAAFRYADQTTRIVSIWDQTIESSNYPPKFFYGTEYRQNQINRALLVNDPFSVVPSKDEIGHGTMLAGVAAGSVDIANNFSGVAPDTEIVVVKLKEAKQNIREFFRIPDGALCFQENDIILGIQYLVDIAKRLDRPIAICIGVGTSQGSHEGESILCKYLNDEGNVVGHSVVVASGNEGNERHHYYGEINPSSEFDIIGLHIGNDEKGFSMELWGYAPNIVEVDIYAPTGAFVGRIPSSFLQRNTLEMVFEQTTIYIDNNINEDITGNQLILFRFFNAIEGVWRFVVSGTGDLTLRYHIWLPINNFLSSNTYFLNADSNTTLSAPANAINSISVTAYNDANNSLYYYTSRGFTKNNGLKPDVAAPGVNISSPAMSGGYYNYTGSSAAAAHATGITAMLLEWGILKGNFTTLNNVILRKMLVSGARRSPTISYPDQAWGFGILDIYRTFKLFYEED